MSEVLTATAPIPRGAVEFLKRINSGISNDGNGTPDKTRAWLRRHGLVKTNRQRGGYGSFAGRGWTYELTDEGSRFLAAQDALSV